MVWVSRPKAWTLDTHPQPAEQFDQFDQTEAAALEQLEFVIEGFDETTVMPTLEIVENPALPVTQGVEEFVKTI